MNHYLAGVGRAILFYHGNLIGLGKTDTQNTLSFSATPEEVRAGMGNSLWGRYFHDSTLTVSISDAMFKLEYIAMKLGVDIKQGGLAMYESPAEGDTTTSNAIKLTNTPVAFDGAMVGWYKKPADAKWSVGTISDGSMQIPDGGTGEHYCIKYFYQNKNARMVTIPANFNPDELHVVLVHDLYNAESGKPEDIRKSSIVGHLITDIPRLQLDPNLELNLTPTTSAPVDLTGTAMSVNSGVSCEEESYYGTMTEEIFGADWKDNVVAIAVENSAVELGNLETETLIVRAVFDTGVAQRVDNKNFTFTSSEPSHATVGANDGLVTGQDSPGKSYIKVALTGAEWVEPAQVEVTVS